MMQTVEAIIDTQGRVSLLESVKLTRKHRALVIILDDKKVVENEESIVGSITLIDEGLEYPNIEKRNWVGSYEGQGEVLPEFFDSNKQ